MTALPRTYQKLTAVKTHDDLREAATLLTVDLEDPAPGELLVQNHVTGVNAADYLMAAGRYLMPTPPPYDLGAESVGVVVAVGEGVSGFKEGDAVMALGAGYREYFTVPANRAIPIPQPLPEFVALGVSGLTASIALEVTGEMTQNETVLVTAAAGGTGSFVVQLAKAAGNRVIGTCGSAEKAAYLRALGCDRPVNYREENFKDVLKQEAPQGVDIVFESVGGEMFDTAANALAVKGRLIVIGAVSEYQSGPQIISAPRPIYQLLSKSASMRGFWLMHYIEHAQQHLMKLFQMMQSGQLKVALDTAEFKGVAQALDAIEHLYQGQSMGKVVLRY